MILNHDLIRQRIRPLLLCITYSGSFHRKMLKTLIQTLGRTVVPHPLSLWIMNLFRRWDLISILALYFIYVFSCMLMVFLPYQKIGRSKDVKMVKTICTSEEESDSAKQNTVNVKNGSDNRSDKHKTEPAKVFENSVVSDSNATTSDKTSDAFVDNPEVMGNNAVSAPEHGSKIFLSSGNSSKVVKHAEDVQEMSEQNKKPKKKIHDNKRKNSSERDDGEKAEPSKKKKKGKREKVKLKRNMTIYKGSAADGSNYLYSKDTPNVSLVPKASSV